MRTNARTTNGESMDRRQFLRVSAGTMAAAGVAAGGTDPVAAQSADPLDEWFADVDNYEGVLDRTGKSEVRVAVGSQANGGGFGFGPAAVAVDPSTTVVWEWTGEGGVHNVAETGGPSRATCSTRRERPSRTRESSGTRACHTRRWV